MAYRFAIRQNNKICLNANNSYKKNTFAAELKNWLSGILPKAARRKLMSLFEEFGLRKEILRAISEMGFEEPTPIQAETIPYLLTPNADLIGLAQTGTGKTAGFGLPILQQIDYGQKTIQALVLCPTRELCMQITRDMQNFAKYVPEFKIVAVYGGASIQPQIQALKGGVHMVVATPGRAMDLLNRKLLKVNNVKWLVLDEADEMLSMGFKDDLGYDFAGYPVGEANDAVFGNYAE
jgi:ATP-dependent RNA helicase DeaD